MRVLVIKHLINDEIKTKKVRLVGETSNKKVVG